MVMGALSCFSCFGGQKTGHLESSEPARQVSVHSQDEKKVSSPRKVSNEPKVIEEEHAKDTVVQPESKTEDAVSTTARDPSPLAESRIDIPPSPAALECTSNERILEDTTHHERSSSDNPVTISRSTPHITQPIRTASSASTHSSRGSSLILVSTKATTPPRSPTDAEPKSLPPVVASPSERETSKINPDVEEVRVSAERVISPVPELEPSSQQPEPQSEFEATDLKTLEAFATATSALPPFPDPLPETKPILDLKTTSEIPSTGARRASYEDDTPTTPSTTSRPTISRLSTAPATLSHENTTGPKSKADKEKRKSRLSRFLSVSAKEPKNKSRVTVMAKEVDMPAVAEVREGGEEDRKERGVTENREKLSWEKEVEKGIVGRKWREEDDNESLFCY
jgi:hypothetical protein